MKGLEIGDRVEVLRNGNGIDAGTKGTIIEIIDYIIGVELDEYEGGHSCGGKGKKGHCRCINSEFLRKIEEKEVEKMSDFKIGDRVKVVSDPRFIEFAGEDSIIGMTGTVKELNEAHADVEFDDYGENGSCWYVPYDYLEKIEDTEGETEEESKVDTLEQKILEVLRKEIGVDIGEEFDLYENGEKQWTCKFDEVGFSHEIDDEFRESGLWKQIVCKFHSYQFKKKPFVPKYGEDYFFLTINNRCNDNKNIFFGVKTDTWVGVGIDYGRLALRNVFKSSSEALENRDKLKERLNELRRGE